MPAANTPNTTLPITRRRRLQTTLALLFSGGLLIWLFATLDWVQVWVAFHQANYVWVGLGLLTVLLNIGTRSLRWQVLLNSPVVTLGDTFRALVLGQLLNLILPARLGDVGRAYLITQTGYRSQTQALATILLEKLWDILALVVLVGLLSWWLVLPVWVTLPTRLLAMIGGGALLAMGALLGWRYRGQRWETLFQRWPRLERLVIAWLDGFEGMYHPRLLAAAAFWSALNYVFGILTNLMLLAAFGLPPSVALATLLLVALHLGVAVPSVPGQLGVFEGISVAILILFNINPEIALAYSFLLHLVVLLPPVVLGLGGLWRLDQRSRQAVWAG